MTPGQTFAINRTGFDNSSRVLQESAFNDLLFISLFVLLLFSVRRIIILLKYPFEHGYSAIGYLLATRSWNEHLSSWYFIWIYTMRVMYIMSLDLVTTVATPNTQMLNSSSLILILRWVWIWFLLHSRWTFPLEGKLYRV